MKNIILLLTISLTFFSCNESAVSTVVEVNNDEPFYDLYEDLMLTDAGNLFRGVDFNMSRTEIRKIELDRSTASETDSEKENELVITTDMGSEVLDFADIKYTFDEQGLYFIHVETYAITKDKADYVFNKIKDTYTSSLGEGSSAEDGFLEFNGSSKDYKYQVAIKPIDLPATDEEKGSYGMYLIFSIQ